MGDDQEDWRISSQGNYLMGVEVVRAVYKQKSERWDHDHCEFCWAKFTEQDAPGCPQSLHVGYAAHGGQHWICEDCFRDFRDRFQWRVVDVPNGPHDRRH